ncbi:MAG TPA: hypothetical protein VGS27_24895 [Candidatus Sulfotelmatobacter sp.]|nr:hypothetical protein [Candidatus Sulfotelmatobacter sp.]
MRLGIRLATYLCLSLMVWTAGAESTHHHANQTKSASCLICVVAHSANPAPNASADAPAFAAVGILREEAVVVAPRVEFSDLSNRGPPAL